MYPKAVRLRKMKNEKKKVSVDQQCFVSFSNNYTLKKEESEFNNEGEIINEEIGNPGGRMNEKLKGWEDRKASKLYRVNAPIIVFVFVLYCIL